ncbi:unnamed protein product, partial [marine sediment metagenome]
MNNIKMCIKRNNVNQTNLNSDLNQKIKKICEYLDYNEPIQKVSTNILSIDIDFSRELFYTECDDDNDNILDIILLVSHHGEVITYQSSFAITDIEDFSFIFKDGRIDLFKKMLESIENYVDNYEVTYDQWVDIEILINCGELFQEKFTITLFSNNMAIGLEEPLSPITPITSTTSNDEDGHYEEGHFEKGHYEEGHFEKGHFEEGHFEKGHF